MKKWTWIGALALLIGAGYLGFQQYKIYIPGIISEWREPIGENRPIAWAQGPAVAPSLRRSLQCRASDRHPRHSSHAAPALCI